MRKLIAVAFVAGGIFLWWSGYESGHSQGSAPDVSYVTVRGQQLRLSELRGRAVLMTFWASDCRPCLAEIPELDQLQREWSTPGLEVIAVAMQYDLPSRVWALVEAARIPYQVVLDSSGALATAFGGISGVPTTFLIAPDGTIHDRWSGPLDFARVRRRLTSMLGEF